MWISNSIFCITLWAELPVMRELEKEIKPFWCLVIFKMCLLFPPLGPIQGDLRVSILTPVFSPSCLWATFTRAPKWPLFNFTYLPGEQGKKVFKLYSTFSSLLPFFSFPSRFQGVRSPDGDWSHRQAVLLPVTTSSPSRCAADAHWQSSPVEEMGMTQGTETFEQWQPITERQHHINAVCFPPPPVVETASLNECELLSWQCARIVGLWTWNFAVKTSSLLYSSAQSMKKCYLYIPRYSGKKEDSPYHSVSCIIHHSLSFSLLSETQKLAFMFKHMFEPR